MSAPSVDDHTEEFEQLAGLSALDALEGDELARFERHAAQCERCRLVVRLDRETLARLSVTPPEMDASPDFKARLMQRAAAELAQSTTTQATVEPIPLRPPPSNVVPLWRRSPWVRAIAALFVVGLITAGTLTYENQVVDSYVLSGSLPGIARVNVHRSGAAELDMRGVPDPEPGFVYELWVIPQGQQPIPIDTTTRGDASLNLPSNLRGSTVAITRETRRVEVPTPPVLLSTVVQS
jgi:anti-sigma-K factor RskA